MTTLTPAAAIADPVLLGPYFAGDSWATWRAVLKAAYAEPLNRTDRALFKQVAGDRDPPTRPVKELVVIAGRRSAKDSIASALATVAATDDYSAQLRPGERAVVMCLAVDREQAKIVHRYIVGYFHALPLLRPLVVSESDDGLELVNGVEIVVATNSYRSVRGRTIACAIFDEAAFWRSEDSANPDSETYAAIRPGMVTLPGAILVIITTAYRKSGLAYNKFARSFGQNDENCLVVYGPSTAFNPTLPREIIDDALRDDPEAAGAEWLSQWRSDLSDFLDRELVDAAIDRGIVVRPPAPGAAYHAFADPSGGRSDSFTMAVSHADANRIVVDLIYERRAPFDDPFGVIHEIAELLRSYGVATVFGDNWGAELIVEGFRREGIIYGVSERNRSEIYLNALPLFTSGRARLVEHARGERQLASLERRTTRAGRDTVGKSKGDSHDDVANAICGALVLAAAAAAPALIRASELMGTDGRPVPMPTTVNAVFSSMAVAENGVAAVVYWARAEHIGTALTLLDFDVAPLSSLMFAAIRRRMAELAAECRQRYQEVPHIFTTRPLYEAALACDVAAATIDTIARADPAELALHAANFVNAGKIKITALAHEKARQHPLAAALDFRATGAGDDPLHKAALWGVIAALDPAPERWARPAA